MLTWGRVLDQKRLSEYRCGLCGLRVYFVSTKDSCRCQREDVDEGGVRWSESLHLINTGVVFVRCVEKA